MNFCSILISQEVVFFLFTHLNMYSLKCNIFSLKSLCTLALVFMRLLTLTIWRLKVYIVGNFINYTFINSHSHKNFQDISEQPWLRITFWSYKKLKNTHQTWTYFFLWYRGENGAFWRGVTLMKLHFYFIFLHLWNVNTERRLRISFFFFLL